jgi:hypothetical protein
MVEDLYKPLINIRIVYYLPTGGVFLDFSDLHIRNILLSINILSNCLLMIYCQLTNKHLVIYFTIMPQSAALGSPVLPCSTWIIASAFLTQYQQSAMLAR